MDIIPVAVVIVFLMVLFSRLGVSKNDNTARKENCDMGPQHGIRK